MQEKKDLVTKTFVFVASPDTTDDPFAQADDSDIEEDENGDRIINQQGKQQTLFINSFVSDNFPIFAELTTCNKFQIVKLNKSKFAEYMSFDQHMQFLKTSKQFFFIAIKNFDGFTDDFKQFYWLYNLKNTTLLLTATSDRAVMFGELSEIDREYYNLAMIIV